MRRLHATDRNQLGRFVRTATVLFLIELLAASGPAPATAKPFFGLSCDSTGQPSTGNVQFHLYWLGPGILNDPINVYMYIDEFDNNDNRYGDYPHDIGSYQVHHMQTTPGSGPNDTATYYPDSTYTVYVSGVGDWNCQNCGGAAAMCRCPIPSYSVGRRGRLRPVCCYTMVPTKIAPRPTFQIAEGTATAAGSDYTVPIYTHNLSAASGVKVHYVFATFYRNGVDDAFHPVSYTDVGGHSGIFHFPAGGDLSLAGQPSNDWSQFRNCEVKASGAPSGSQVWLVVHAFDKTKYWQGIRFQVVQQKP